MMKYDHRDNLLGPNIGTSLFMPHTPASVFWII